VSNVESVVEICPSDHEEGPKVFSKINEMGWSNKKGSRAAPVRQEFRKELPVLDVRFPLLEMKRIVPI
jgi:hypothetical protein